MSDNPYELYSSYERLAEATEHIRTMVSLAAQKVRATAGFLRCRPTDEMVESAFDELIAPVLRKHRKGGAQDSEPYYHVHRELSELVGMDY